TDEHGEPLPKIFVGQETARRAVGGIADRRVGIPGTDVADAAEAIAARANVGGEHGLDPATQPQVRVAADARAMPGLALNAPRAHGGATPSQLAFAPP